MVKDFLSVKIVKSTNLSVYLAQFLLFFLGAHNSIVDIIDN